MRSGKYYYRLNRAQRKTLSKHDLRVLHLIQNTVQEKEFKPADVYEKIGYEILGPILFGYVMWLHKQIDESHADAVLFLSREGKLLESAYRAVFRDCDTTRIEYVNVSRLALSKATVNSVNNWDEFAEKFKSLFRGLTTVDELLALFEVQFPTESYKRMGIHGKTKITEVENKDILFTEMMIYGGDSFHEQNRLAKEYLEAKGVGKGTTIVADIGWSGTMQSFLSELFPNERFIGAYIAVGNSATSKRHLELDRRGFWFGADDDHSWQMVRFTIAAFEFMFLNSEGTTIGYIKQGNVVNPIKGKEVCSECERINKAHEASIKFICDMNEKRLIIDTVNTNVWFVPYYNFAIRPGKETISFFRGFKANNGVKEYSFLPEHSLGYYFLHLKKALKEFEINNCKIIWLYGLVPIDFPYYELLCFLTGRVGFKSDYYKKYLRAN